MIDHWNCINKPRQNKNKQSARKNLWFEPFVWCWRWWCNSNSRKITAKLGHQLFVIFVWAFVWTEYISISHFNWFRFLAKQLCVCFWATKNPAFCDACHYTLWLAACPSLPLALWALPAPRLSCKHCLCCGSWHNCAHFLSCYWPLLWLALLSS